MLGKLIMGDVVTIVCTSIEYLRVNLDSPIYIHYCRHN